METNQKCCRECANGATEGGYALAIAAPYCLNKLCTCHPQEEKEWAEGVDAIFGDTLHFHHRQAIEEFIREQKHLSYQAGLKFAIERTKSKHVVAKKSYPSDSWDCGYHDALFAVEKSLTSELDKEVT